MTTKLTLSIHKETVKKAKRISRKRGVSISRMVEQFLQNLPDNHTPSTSAVKKLSGIAGKQRTTATWKEIKTEHLKKKYGV